MTTSRPVSDHGSTRKASRVLLVVLAGVLATPVAGLALLLAVLEAVGEPRTHLMVLYVLAAAALLSVVPFAASVAWRSRAWALACAGTFTTLALAGVVWVVGASS